MDVNGNSAADDATIYINAAPSNGGQSMEPMSGSRMIKSNPGPTASIDVSGTTDLDGSHVIAAGLTVNFTVLYFVVILVSPHPERITVVSTKEKNLRSFIQNNI